MRSSKIIIANPAVGIYKGELNPGQAAYHIFLDFYARKIGRSNKIYCPRYSLNSYGKRAENNGDDPRRSAEKMVQKYLGDYRLRDKLHLSYSGTIIDSDDSVTEAVLELVENLRSKGLIKKRGVDLYLQMEKFPIDALDEIDFHPKSLLTEIKNIASKSIQQEFRITKETKYSLESYVKNNFSPLFIVANMWKKGNDTLLLPISHILTTKYCLFRIISQTLGYDSPNTDIVYRFPKIQTKESFNRKFYKNVDDPSFIDDVRLAYAYAHRKRPEIIFDERLLQRSRKVRLKIENMNKVFSNTNPCLAEIRGLEEKVNFDFFEEAKKFERKTLELSRRISLARNSNNWNSKKDELSKEFLSLLTKEGLIFIPYTTKKAIDSMRKKNDIKG